MKPEVTSWMVDILEENSAAVQQNGSVVYQIPRFLLPAGAREGDTCEVSVAASSAPDSTTFTVTVDRQATQAAKARSAAQLASTPKSKDPGGPIKL